MKQFLEEIKLWLGLITGLIIASVALLDKTSTLLETHPYVFPIVSGSLAIICFVYVWQANKKQKTIREMGKTEEVIKPKFRQGVRITTSIICLLIITGSIMKWANSNSGDSPEINPNGDFVIGIADFFNAHNEALQEDIIMPRFYSELGNKLLELGDTTIYPKKLHKRILQDRNSGKKAKILGEKNKNSIVVYGWYQNIPDSIWAEIGVEVIKQQFAHFQLDNTLIYTAKARSFQVQVNLAEDISNLIYAILGITKCMEQDFNNALELINKVEILNSSSDPLSVEIDFYKGFINHQLGQDSIAQLYYERVTNLDTSNSEAYFNNALIQIKNQNYVYANRLTQKALKLNPEDTSYTKLNNFLTKVITEENTSNDKGNEPIDNPNASKNKDKFALPELSSVNAPQIDSLSKEEIDIRVIDAKEKIKNRLYDDAYLLISDAIESNPNDTQLLFYRGLACFKRKSFKKAIQDFEKIIGISSDHTIAYYYAGVSYQGLGDEQNASDLLIKCNKVNSNAFSKYRISEVGISRKRALYEDYLFKGRALIELKLYKAAQEHLTRAISQFEDSSSPNKIVSEAYYYRGFVQRLRKYKRTTIRDFNKAIEIDPEYAQAYHQRGIAILEMNLTGDYCLDFQKAVNLGSLEAKPYLSKYCN